MSVNEGRGQEGRRVEVGLHLTTETHTEAEARQRERKEARQTDRLNQREI